MKSQWCQLYAFYHNYVISEYFLKRGKFFIKKKKSVAHWRTWNCIYLQASEIQYFMTTSFKAQITSVSVKCDFSDWTIWHRGRTNLYQNWYNVRLQKICPKGDSFNTASFTRQGTNCLRGSKESWIEPCPSSSSLQSTKNPKERVRVSHATSTEHIINSRLWGTAHLNQTVLRNSESLSSSPWLNNPQPHRWSSLIVLFHLWTFIPMFAIKPHGLWESSWRGALEPGEKGSKVLPFFFFFSLWSDSLHIY